MNSLSGISPVQMWDASRKMFSSDGLPRISAAQRPATTAKTSPHWTRNSGLPPAAMCSFIH